MSLNLIHFIDIKKKTVRSLPESIVSKNLSKENNLSGKGAPRCICKRGSFTLEAAVVFPFTACFFAFLLFFFCVMKTELVVQNALEDTGRSLSVLASMEESGNIESFDYLATAKGMMSLKLMYEKSIEKYVLGGILGIRLSDSSFTGDVISLKVDYYMKFPIGLLGKYAYRIYQQTEFRKWTGYHQETLADKEIIWVYITETGNVYHQRKSCPYLDLSISATEAEKLEGIRNKSGQKYTPCSDCAAERMDMPIVYITDYGDKYHYDLGCRALKRTVYQINLTETGGRKACSKCWK